MGFPGAVFRGMVARSLDKALPKISSRDVFRGVSRGDLEVLDAQLICSLMRHGSYGSSQ